jgi:hypothetical protein
MPTPDPLSPALGTAGTLDVMSATPTTQMKGAPARAPGSRAGSLEQ